MSTGVVPFKSAAKTPAEDRIRMRNRLAQRRHREKKKQLSRTNNDEQTAYPTTSEEQSGTIASLDLTPPETQWDDDHMNVLDYLDFESAAESAKGIDHVIVPAGLGQEGAGINEKTTMANMLASLANIEGGDIHPADSSLKVTDSWLLSHQSTAPVREHRAEAPLSSMSMPQPLFTNGSKDNASHPLPSQTGSTMGLPKALPPRRHRRSMSHHQQSTASTQCPPQNTINEANGVSQAPSTTTASVAGSAGSAGTESLEARFERLLSMVEEAGFDSIDSMVATYYTAQLSDQSIMQPIQAASRTRRLRTLLTALQEGQLSWTDKEKRAYSEEVTRAAEQIYSAELRGRCQQQQQQQQQQFGRRGSLAAYRSIAEQTGDEYPAPSGGGDLAQRIMDILSGGDAAEFLQRERASFQHRAPETWSLMNELARSAGVQPYRRAEMSAAVLYLLTFSSTSSSSS